MASATKAKQSWSELLRPPARWQARGMALRLMITQFAHRLIPASDEADSGCGGRHARSIRDASLGESLPFEGVVRREVPSNS